MGSRAVTLTSAQADAVDRHAIDGVIYLLSGTLVGRDSVPDATFYWSTREVTAFGQTFEPYLGPPQNITRTMGFEPGAQSVHQQVKIPVRNLPFAHAESMVAAITDDDFRVENTTATLRVAYLKPGQTPDDLVDADWTPVIENGFLGPADEVQLDGLILPLYPRNARRNQHLFWPRMPGKDTVKLTGAIDRKAAGIIPPIVGGAPRGWIKAVPMNLGVRGFLSSGYSGGATVIKFQAITDGSERLVSGNVPTDDSNVDTSDILHVGEYGTGTGMAGLLIHHAGPVYLVSGSSYDADAQEFTVTLASGLATDVPRGGFVQQWGPAFDTNQSNPNNTFKLENQIDSYHWVLAGHRFETGLAENGTYTPLRFGWLFSDGEVRPAPHGTWPFFDPSVLHGDIDQPGPHYFALEQIGGLSLGGEAPTNDRAKAQYAVLTRGTRYNNIVAPVYYDPVGGTVEVTQQPEFTSTQTASLLNYPTGGAGGTNNDWARDGNETTAMTLAASEVATLTFNDAPSPFANDDTVASTLHVVTAGTGTVTFTDTTGSIIFGTVSTVGKFRFTQASPRDFNETVRCVGGGSGGNVAELWWEHDLSAAVQSTRTTDVAITSSTAPLGPAMEYAELVYKVESPSMLHRLLASGGLINRQDLYPDISGAVGKIETMSATEWSAPYMTDPDDLIFYQAPYPTNVMMGLHCLLNGTEGDVDTIDLDAYAAAHQRYLVDNLRLSFVWTDENIPRSWTEIEQRLSVNSRSYTLYGPSGHQLLYLETASGYEALPVLQSFRLPGTPGSNTFDTGAAVFERTLTTELVNQAEVLWEQDTLNPRDYTRVVSAENAESVADIGARRSDGGAYELDMHHVWEGNPNWTASQVVSGIAQFYADRQAFASTRFNFDTAWIAQGLDRGSIIRVTYAVSTSPESYRNVTAEVETISISPINRERVRLRARAVTKPQKGIEPAFIWTDVFTEEGDFWATRIIQEFDTWSDYWSVK